MSSPCPSVDAPQRPKALAAEAPPGQPVGVVRPPPAGSWEGSVRGELGARQPGAMGSAMASCWRTESRRHSRAGKVPARGRKPADQRTSPVHPVTCPILKPSTTMENHGMSVPNNAHR